MSRPTILALDLARVHAIVFDAFGTLVEIGDNRRPFGRLMHWISQNHVSPAEDEAAWLIRRNVDLKAAALAAGAVPPPDLLDALERDLEVELASISAFEDTAPALTSLRARGYAIGICSNLVAPYMDPMIGCLPFSPDAAVWSFAIGAIKPEPAIYAAVCTAMRRQPEEILFVGDTWDADVAGPRAFGMRALHLVRDREPCNLGEIGCLDELFPRLEGLSCA